MFEDPRKLGDEPAVQVVQVVEPRTLAIVECLHAAFGKQELGLEPHQTRLGETDYYTCPCCKARLNIRGSAYGKRDIDDPGMVHKPTCVLIELKTLVDDLERETPIFFAH
jgi:hypothetical protein